MNLHFLHGFLGLPSDWDEFRKDFVPHNCIAHAIEDFLTPHNFNTKTNKKNNFQIWAQNFNSSIFASNAKKNKNGNDVNILIGYSLGGRLALHSLLEKNSWTAAIIISANPGLVNENDKTARVQSDETWAQRFRTESWDSLMRSWNAQSVFSERNNKDKLFTPSQCVRNEKFYNRENIPEILTQFSLGKQDNLRSEIKKISIPILWISGEHDQKFSTLGNEMADLNKKITSMVIANAGHRVPWENHEKFARACRKFLTFE